MCESCAPKLAGIPKARMDITLALWLVALAASLPGTGENPMRFPNKPLPVRMSGAGGFRRATRLCQVNRNGVGAPESDRTS